MRWLARSPDSRRGISAQPYENHIRNVIQGCIDRWNAACPLTGMESAANSLKLAAEYHDLGKLLSENQDVLREETNRRLPLNHSDAGVAHAINIGDLGAAILIYAHHAGLPDLVEQSVNSEPFRNAMESIERGVSIRDIVNRNLTQLIARHQQDMGLPMEVTGPLWKTIQPKKREQLLLRMLLSCLVDADHSDAAKFGGFVPMRPCRLNTSERVDLLDSYVRRLSAKELGCIENNRNQLRRRLFDSLKKTSAVGISACNAPVGTGKTTAIMAHLLKTASERNLQRIFIVAPYTNIIDQTVQVMRDALVGYGEDPEMVVAAHHHRLEFDSLAAKQYSFGWEAPIVVTTAVQFFESLAAAKPASLRKIHQLAHSGIFIDEAHSAVPIHLWPTAWRWLRELEEKWGCHIVLGSGSLTRYWNIPGLFEEAVTVKELVDEGLQADLAAFETRRISYRKKEGSLSLKGLVQWVHSLHGPRLCIFNTVQSAAVVAAYIQRVHGRDAVEHMSTSLSPRSRALTLKRIQERLANPQDNDWTLVATSCLEAGVNLSFRNGMREIGSIWSYIQTGGRVSRSGEYPGAELWAFRLRNNTLFPEHPAMRESSEVFEQMWQEGLVDADHVTEALARELRRAVATDSRMADLVKRENAFQFPQVQEMFQVIDDESVTAVVDHHIAERIARGEALRPAEIMQDSVSIVWHSSCGRSKKNEAIRQGLRPLTIEEGSRATLFEWTLEYDGFLGYMAGIVPLLLDSEE